MHWIGCIFAQSAGCWLQTRVSHLDPVNVGKQLQAHVGVARNWPPFKQFKTGHEVVDVVSVVAALVVIPLQTPHLTYNEGHVE